MSADAPPEGGFVVPEMTIVIAAYNEEKRLAFDVEILTLAWENGYHVAEVPIKWADCAGSRVRPILDSLQMLKDLVKIRWAAASIKS